MTLQIQQTVEKANETVRQMLACGDADPRALAIAVEMNQLFCEYLDRLEVADVDLSVIVKVDGKTIKFQNIEGIASWLTSK